MTYRQLSPEERYMLAALEKARPQSVPDRPRPGPSPLDCLPRGPAQLHPCRRALPRHHRSGENERPALPLPP